MKIQFLKNGQTQFLRDTVKFYNLTNRAEENNMCQYRPTPQSPGCALGRHLPEPLSRALFGSVVYVLASQPGVLGWMEVLGIPFLADVQSLHDCFAYWNKEGLNQAGRDKVEQLCKIHGLELSQVIA